MQSVAGTVFFLGFALEIRFLTFFVKIRFANSFTKIRVASNPAQTALFVALFNFRHLQCLFLPAKVAVSLKKQIFPLEN